MSRALLRERLVDELKEPGGGAGDARLRDALEAADRFAAVCT
jgi:hypothetical protein